MNADSLPVSEPKATWLYRRDPRLRIVAAALFALVTVSLNRFPALFAALAIAVLLATAAGLTARALLRRLAALEGFMIVLLLFLPFTVPGETWLQLGPVTATWEGLYRALAIAIKANAVTMALLALLGTLEPVVLGHALARLRVPDKLVHLFLFTVRYIGVLQEEYLRLRQAMRARAFTARSDRHTWRTLGWLVGMLLVRSLERSQRILAAMKCRGFQGRFYLAQTGAWHPDDSRWLMVLSLLLCALLLAEHLL
jgi:cobalt/nickel transport system permease protein